MVAPGGILAVKSKVQIWYLSSHEVGKKLVRQLRDTYPDGYSAPNPTTEMFVVNWIWEDDPRLAAVLRVLDQAGLKPYRHPVLELDPKTHFRIMYSRKYDSSELSEAGWLQILPARQSHGGETRGKDGILELN